jgi:hypothetical protein
MPNSARTAYLFQCSGEDLYGVAGAAGPTRARPERKGSPSTGRGAPAAWAEPDRSGTQPHRGSAK